MYKCYRENRKGKHFWLCTARFANDIEAIEKLSYQYGDMIIIVKNESIVYRSVWKNAKVEIGDSYIKINYNYNAH